MGLQALLPQAPDRTHQVAFEGTDGRPFGLARAQAAGHVILGRGPTAQLRQGHAVEEGLEPAVAPTGEAVADPPGRGGLPGRDAGLGGYLGVTAEAPARFQDAGAPAGSGSLPLSGVRGEWHHDGEDQPPAWRSWSAVLRTYSYGLVLSVLLSVLFVSMKDVPDFGEDQTPAGPW